MRLTWRDVVATLVVVAGLALALSATQGWNWPLINGVRAGIIALGLTGIVACSVSGWAQDANEQGSSFYRSPFFIAGAIVGVFLLGIGIVGLFVGAVQFLFWMMAGFAALWVITLIHRLLPAGAPSGRPTAA
jgi:hypothetical protein